MFHFSGKSELSNVTDFHIYAHSHFEYFSLVRKTKNLICVQFNFFHLIKFDSFTKVFFPEMSQALIYLCLGHYLEEGYLLSQKDSCGKTSKHSQKGTQA